MTNHLKDMLNNIPVPDELDINIELGFERADRKLRKRRFSKILVAIAASLVIIITSTGIVGFDKVEAAIRKALQYVPGYNVLVDIEEGKVLALQEQVVYEEDDVYVVIRAASKLDKSFNIMVESNQKLYEVYLKDEKGSILLPAMTSRFGGGEFEKGEYYFEVEEQYDNYSLLVEDIEIPFTLEKTAEVEDFLQLGNNTTDKGISIVAIKKPIEDGLMISLLNQSEEKTISDYPFKQSIWFGQILGAEESMYIIDKEGEKTYPSIPSSYGNLMSDFYFDIENQEGLKLVLPYVKIRYQDIKSDKIKIQTPREGEIQSINKVLDLGKLEIEVIDVRREGEEILISLDYHSLEDEILDYVSVMGGSGFKSGIGYGIGPNEDTGYMELSINREDVGRTFSIYFESPSTLLFGDWVIDLD